MAKDLITHVRQALAPVAGREGGDWTIEDHPMVDAIVITERLRAFAFTITHLDLEEGDQWLERLEQQLKEHFQHKAQHTAYADVPGGDATKAPEPDAPQSPTEPAPGLQG